MTPPAPSLNQKLALALGATLITAGIGYSVFRMRAHGPRDSVELVDNRKAIAELLEQRATQSPIAPTPTNENDPDEPPPLVREEIPVETARMFFPLSGLGRPYNPKFFFARPPDVHWDVEWPEHPNGKYETRTNEIGIREDVPVRAEHPNLRVIVTGDSHTDGVCSNSESFPNVLERLLAERDPKRSVEVLNMGIGGYNFWNYLGVLEHWAPILKPDVFVIACYGGNDFYETLGLERYFHKRKAGKASRLPIPLLELQGTGMVSQEFLQTGMMLSNPEDVKIAIDTANAITREILAIAAKQGCRVILLYIPPPSVGQPSDLKEELDRILPLTDWKPEELATPSRLADGWLAYGKKRGVPILDLRPIFLAETKPLYWRADRHINLLANEIIAKALLPVVEAAAAR